MWTLMGKFTWSKLQVFIRNIRIILHAHAALSMEEVSQLIKSYFWNLKSYTTASNERNFKATWRSFNLNIFNYNRPRISISFKWGINLFSIVYVTLIWNKARVIYYVNNWVYTTNHKRIAVNYFWFVIFSGICGMVLATIIRLEMAYPGVGILAGDSLQYLSVVTAHAVIMVFFMIMPLLFGAFGNFLLPTQLGVHDVAFPRLNSAAFWFLPAGLLMLVQLVCLDRRYQRMNCFNIREIQALLKARFFADLVSANDHHQFLNKTAIGLRYNTTSIDSINPNMLLFYRYGLNTTSNSRYYNLIVSNRDIGKHTFLNDSSLLYKLMTLELYSLYQYAFGLFQELSSQPVTDRTLPTGFFTDPEFWQILKRFMVGTAGWADNNEGFYTCLTLFETSFATLRSELKRQWYLWVTDLDFNEPLWLRHQWYLRFWWQSREDIMLGLFHNNMGWHRDRLQTHPQPRGGHPTITTENGIFFLYLTGIHHLASKSVWIIVRKCFRISLDLFFQMYDAFWREVAYINNAVSSLLHFIKSFDFNSFVQECKEKLNNEVLWVRQLFSAWVTDATLWKQSYTLPYFYSLSGVNIFNTPTPLFIDDFKWTSFIATNIFNLPGFALTNHKNIRPLRNQEVLNIQSDKWATDSTTTQLFNQGQESVTSTRYQQTSNPLFSYNFKVGNYLPFTTYAMYPHLFNSINEVTRGIRKSAWFFSKDVFELLTVNFDSYTSHMTLKANPIKTTELSPLTLPHTHAFYNFFYVMSSHTDLMNKRWSSLQSMNQKFYKLFSTSSMQQRVYANWRQLKFTREAWRCKLLASRHQKTLFHRYLDEENVLWTVERNAKDLLPGWAMITPFSARTRFTAMGKVDLGLMGVFLVLNSSIVSSANFLVTYRYLSTLNNRKMRDARAFFAESVMVASWMMIAANPMLAIGILMLLSDRHWQTSFFDYSGGGDTVLFQHMFWFFGHPEVYVIMIPVFGFTNTILSFYLRKRVSARASLMYSMYTIAFLGFFVWGHHMYMVGLAHTTRMLFSTLTVMISIPAATKLMHWCVTMVNSSVSIELPLLFVFLFIFFFVSGGISGMAVAHTGMDILFHDTFYVIGHFHVMFAGSAMFGSFGAFYFYFTSIFGVKFSRIWGYLHCTYYLIGQLMTVVPMFWLGYAGMPRRVLDYPSALGGWHAIVSAGHLLSVAGMMAFFIMIFDSLRQAKPVTRNTFGITRFNTRLNFYLYEANRTHFLKKKSWYIARAASHNSLTLNKLKFTNNEYLETTLYSYSFVKNV